MIEINCYDLGSVGWMKEINCYGLWSVSHIIAINYYGQISVACMIEINCNGLGSVGCMIFFFGSLKRYKACTHTHSPSRLLCTRDFKKYPADPSERLLVLPSGPLSLIELCLPYPTGPLTLTRKHGTMGRT